jgi:hypothetical protein
MQAADASLCEYVAMRGLLTIAFEIAAGEL